MTEDRDPLDLTTEDLQALGELISAARRAGRGISVENYGEGWQVGYITPNGGDDLARAEDLATACRAGLWQLQRQGRGR